MSLCVNDKKNKNSPTGIRTPVFHVTGEDTNQLYYWRLLKKGESKVAMGTGRWKKGRGISDISGIDISGIDISRIDISLI